MPDVSRPTYVFSLTSSRVINKRMAMFFEQLTNHGIGVHVASLPRGEWVLDKSERPLPVVRTGSFSVDLLHMCKGRPSSVLCFHWAVLPLAVLLGLIWRVPVVYDEHDHYELNTLEGSGSRFKVRVFSTLVRWIHRLCLPLTQLVTCIHLKDSLLRNHLQKWQPAVLEVHNYPARIWRESRSPEHNKGPVSFVYIGGVYAEKGVAAAASAWESLSSEFRQRSELHIFGEGDQQLIQSLRSRQGIFVHNGVAPETFRRFTATRRCVGLSLLAATPRYSLVGTNCTKLYEYLALGMPVIATSVGEFPDFIERNQVGLLIDGDLNQTQLTQSMAAFLTSESLWNTMSDRASRLMSQDIMTWEHEWERISAAGSLVAIRKAA